MSAECEAGCCGNGECDNGVCNCNCWRSGEFCENEIRPIRIRARPTGFWPWRNRLAFGAASGNTVGRGSPVLQRQGGEAYYTFVAPFRARRLVITTCHRGTNYDTRLVVFNQCLREGMNVRYAMANNDDRRPRCPHHMFASEVTLTSWSGLPCKSTRLY